MKHDFSLGTRVCQRCAQSGYLTEECPASFDSPFFNLNLVPRFNLNNEDNEIIFLKQEIAELKAKVKQLEPKICTCNQCPVHGEK